jgi:hypothetical protein
VVYLTTGFQLYVASNVKMLMGAVSGPVMRAAGSPVVKGNLPNTSHVPCR